jgi:hypothetical protein
MERIENKSKNMGIFFSAERFAYARKEYSLMVKQEASTF